MDPKHRRLPERRLITFENKTWWMICGPKLSTNTGMWRTKSKKELSEETEMSPTMCYVRCQRIPWFGRIVRGNDNNTVKAVMPW